MRETIMVAYVDNKWKPVLREPREIRRGRRKGCYEVVIQVLRETKNGWGMVPRKVIVNTIMGVG